jgi:AcrR family transcriptional regulator
MSPDALRALVHEAVAMLVDSGAIRILASLLVEAQRDPSILEAFRARLLEPRRHLIVAMLERGIERGELRPDTDPLVVTEMIAGAVFGHHAILGQPTTEAWADALVEHVWAAIRA